MEKIGSMTCIDGWSKVIERAQHIGSYTKTEQGKIVGRMIRKRVEVEQCGDCAAKRWQLHVPGCDMEWCTVCDGQAFLCGCEWDQIVHNTFIPSK